jgi:hypothetical protein
MDAWLTLKGSTPSVVEAPNLHWPAPWSLEPTSPSDDGEVVQLVHACAADMGQNVPCQCSNLKLTRNRTFIILRIEKSYVGPSYKSIIIAPSLERVDRGIAFARHATRKKF